MHRTWKTSLVTGVSAAALTLLAAGPVRADTVRTQTTTYRGVVTQIDPAASTIILKTEERPEPMRYTINEKTTYVDAAGNVVTREKIRNEPVTIYTTDDGVVTKVIERSPAGVERKTTTTTERVETPD
ncbi:MAG TPA: hypothetical protein VGK30_16785 [Candidatus Binatia bacterium]|jgi:hypothetical protein